MLYNACYIMLHSITIYYMQWYRNNRCWKSNWLK